MGRHAKVLFGEAGFSLVEHAFFGEACVYP